MIEVKTSAYLQSWSEDRGLWADVYVFCLQTAKTHVELDPLSVAQWRFYVFDRRAMEARTSASMGLSSVERIAGPPVDYDQLAEAIARAATETGYDLQTGRR